MSASRTATERDLSETRVTFLDEKAKAGLLCTFHWVTGELTEKFAGSTGSTHRQCSNGAALGPMGNMSVTTGAFPRA